MQLNLIRHSKIKKEYGLLLDMPYKNENIVYFSNKSAAFVHIPKSLFMIKNIINQYYYFLK